MLPCAARKLLLAAALLGLGAPPHRAQEVVNPDSFKQYLPESKDPLPQAPQNHIDDAGDVLTPEQESAMGQDLADFAGEHDFHFFVATRTFVYGEDANQHALRLGKAWLGQKYGAVIVFDKSAVQGPFGGLGYAGSQDDSRFLTNRMLKEILLKANDAVMEKPNTPVADRIRIALETLKTEFLALKPMLEENRKTVTRQQWQVLQLVLGVMALCLGLLFLAQRFQRQSDLKAGERFLFPDVEVGQRFGAPHGGGVAAQFDPDRPGA
jgi:hypothetical protein